MEYVYLLRRGEHVKTSEPIYKFGRTTQTPKQRFDNYPKGSDIHLVVGVEDCVEMEKAVMKTLKEHFKHRSDIGEEYFEGDPDAMIQAVLFHKYLLPSEKHLLPRAQQASPHNITSEKHPGGPRSGSPPLTDRDGAERTQPQSEEKMRLGAKVFTYGDVTSLSTRPEVEKWVVDTLRYCLGGGKGYYLVKDIEPQSRGVAWLRRNPEDVESQLLAIRCAPSDRRIYDVVRTMLSEITISRDFYLPFPPGGKTEEDPGFFNTFVGIEAAPTPAGPSPQYQPIIDHIMDVWCGGDSLYYNYIIGWLSSIVQHPETKTGVAILLRSEVGGAGKGILVRMLIDRLFGSHCAKHFTKGIPELLNSDTSRYILGFADEVNKSITEEQHDRLKTLITEPTTEHNRISKPSYINLILATNNDDSIRIVAHDRRFFCLEVSSARVGDFDYFERLAGLPQSAYDEFCGYLLNYDLTESGGFNPRDIPATQIKRNLQVVDVSHPEEIVCRLTGAKEFVEDAPVHTDNGLWQWHVTALYNWYKRVYCPRTGFVPVNQRKFSSKMRDLFGDPKRITIDKQALTGHRVPESDVEKIMIRRLGLELFLHLGGDTKN